MFRIESVDFVPEQELDILYGEARIYGGMVRDNAAWVLPGGTVTFVRDRAVSVAKAVHEIIAGHNSE